MVFKNNKIFNVKSRLVLLVFLFLSYQLNAQQVSQNEFFDLSLEELMQVDVTIATKTHLKVNDLPGMVSILNKEDLANQGYATLWESLASLPGIQISIDSTGSRLLVVRGIGKTYSSGKVKLLLNGVAMNSAMNSSSEALMNLPVQQIERVELIRGPGSAVHGEFSYAGVINVITQKAGKGLYSVLADDNSTRVGGYYQWEDKSKNFNASLNVSSSQSDGADLESGLDSGNSFAEPGYSSGLVNTKRDMNSLILNVDFDNVHTSLQWLESKRGDHFGINDYLPPDERKNRITEESLSFHSDVDIELSSHLTLNIGMNWLESSIVKKNQFVGSALVFGALASEPDVVANVNNSEQRVEFNLNLISTGVQNHVLFAEVSSVNIDVGKAEQFLNLDPNTYLPSNTFYSFDSPIKSDQERDILSVTLQDEFSIYENLILTTGVRYDQYDKEIGSSTTPRLALVYHASEKHSFRTQYAEAFRPPTLLEINGALDSATDPETIKTIEFGHHYQSANQSFKSVIFHSKLEDLITFVNVAPFGFSNTDKATIQGVEFEYSYNLANQWKINTNLSLLKTEDKNTGEDIFGAAKVLANAKINYRVNPKVNIETSFNYVGERERSDTDSRDELDDYLISNIALTVKKLGDVSGLSFNAGIKNLFNQDIYYQSEEDTYEGDYPVSDSRSLWLQINYIL